MKKLQSVSFPTFSGLQAYMLPIIIGDTASIPKEYHGYIPLIAGCQLPESHNGTIAYLTIKEDILVPGTTQVMPGIHLDLKGKGFDVKQKRKKKSGIYMANSVQDSCKVWDVILSDEHRKIEFKSCLRCEVNGKTIISEIPKRIQDGRLSLPLVHSDGECNELLVNIFKKTELLDKDTLYLLNEFTPHQSLPVTEETPRQLFRLTVGNIQEWREGECTMNPSVEVPESIFVKHVEYYPFNGYNGW